MKSLWLSLRVEATRPPTFTDALCPNNIPFGLIKNTWPLADMRPKMPEGSVPSTWLMVTERLLGCEKKTDSCAPMLKLCQPIAAFCVVCVMVVLPGAALMEARPQVTTPPNGSAPADDGPKASRRPKLMPFNTKPLAAPWPARSRAAVGRWLRSDEWLGRMDTFIFFNLEVLDGLKPKAV